MFRRFFDIFCQITAENQLCIRTLRKSPTVLHEWDNTIWTVMVEKAIVHRDKSITFVFYNGNEITVGA